MEAGPLKRATLEIEIDGQTELVAVALRDGEWIATSSDGRADGPHVLAALEALGLQKPSLGARSEHPPAPEPASPQSEVAAMLDDLATAIVRAGVSEAQSAPSVKEALATLKEHLGAPRPLGISRAIGRLRESLVAKDAARCARVLDGFSRVAVDLRETSGPPTVRLVSWMGRSDATMPGGARGSRKPLSDRQLLEVGRSWLNGFERRALQRRFLLCLKSGAMYREDFGHDDTRTAGPSPRLLRVGLAERYPGPSPKRVRLMQYEVIPAVREEVLEQAAEFARRDFDELRSEYRKAVKAFPTLSEPFVLVAADHYDTNVAVDPQGRRLPLVGEPGELERVHQVRARAGVRWLAGRLTDEDGIMVLAVHSACVETADGLVFERVH